jgi:CHAT domain-containing protein/Tfp pilus assembly protein PilF
VKHPALNPPQRAILLSTLLALALCAFAQPRSIETLAAQLAAAPDDKQVEALLGGEQATEELFQACRKPAQASLERSEFAPALRAFSAALIVAKRLSNHIDAAIAYRGIGLAYRGMSQTTLALSSYELGYESAVAGDDKTLMAALLRGSAVAKRNLGRIDDAIADDEHSVALYRELHDQRETAAALANLAVNYLRTGNLRRATQILEEARQMALEWPDVLDPIVSNLGRAAAQQGNFLAARDYLEQSVASAERRKATGTMLVALANLGVVYRGMSQLDKAEATFIRALNLARQTHNLNVEATTLLNRANIYESRRRNDLAIADLRLGLDVLKQMDAPLVEAYTLVPLVQLENDCAQTGASPQLERALAIGRQFQAHDILWPALEVQGECALARNDLAQARESFTQSVAEVELLRDLAGGDDHTASPFLADKTKPYHSLLDVALRQHEPEFALQTAERAKARQLLDTVRRGNSNPRTLLNAEERSGEERLNSALTQLDRRLAAIPTGAQRITAQAEWSKAQMQLATYREHLYSVHPGLAGERGDAAPVRLADIGDLLPDTHTALIEFTVTEKVLYIFAIVRGADGQPVLTAHQLACGRTGLTREVSQFHEQLATRSAAYRTAAVALYAKLLGPIAATLRGKDTLIVVPDGPLWDLPFQALIRPDGAHLIERAAVFYTPSLTYLRETRRTRRQSEAPKRLLAIGNPGSARLPNAGREVQGLAAVYRSAPQESRILTGAEATKQVWLQSAPDYRVLHLATHGTLNSANPMYSWLSLAPAAPGRPDDALEAREVIGLNLHADVAVLSACDTARGEVSSGEGMVGMSWAFLMAGVSTTVVSQWSVDSASTTQLMLAFHSQLQAALDSGSGRARALRTGALAVMRSPEHRHPYYWAGFVMVGDGY